MSDFTESEALDVIKAQRELIAEMMQFIGSMVLQDYGKLNDTLVESARILKAAGINPDEVKQ